MMRRALDVKPNTAAKRLRHVDGHRNSHIGHEKYRFHALFTRAA